MTCNRIDEVCRQRYIFLGKMLCFCFATFVLLSFVFAYILPPPVLIKFEDFYEEVYEELSKFGMIEEMHVCDNLGDHLVGNVYAKFSDEEEADAALKGLYGRW